MTKYFLWLLPLFLSINACKQKNSTESTASKPASNAEKVIHLAIWTGYVTPEQLAEFEKQTGYKVSVSNYSSNEELLAKLQAGAEGFDVAVPSDYMVSAMINLELLKELDLKKISNFNDLNKDVTARYYDKSNKFSVPFSWGTTGLAFNKKTVKDPIKSWKEVFGRKDLSGKFTLLDDVRETLGAALKTQGRSLNTRATAEIDAAKKLLLDNKGRVKGFTSETAAGLINGEMAVAQAYSIDALLASKKTNGSVQYVIPEEGCTLWIDNFVIPKGSTNPEGAAKLIDFLLSPQIGAQRASLLFSAPSNTKAVELLTPELKSNTSLFPTKAQLAKCEMLEDLGEDLASWDRAWTEIKASN